MIVTQTAAASQITHQHYPIIINVNSYRSNYSNSDAIYDSSPVYLVVKTNCNILLSNAKLLSGSTVLQLQLRLIQHLIYFSVESYSLGLLRGVLDCVTTLCTRVPSSIPGRSSRFSNHFPRLYSPAVQRLYSHSRFQLSL